ncbi:uncharacterized protein LOC144347792 [Saccoglossus kowalevskii]
MMDTLRQYPCSVMQSKAVWFPPVTEELRHRLYSYVGSTPETRKIQQLFDHLMSIKDSWHAHHFPFVISDYFDLTKMKIEPVGSTAEGLSIPEDTEDNSGEEYDFNLMYTGVVVIESNNHLDGSLTFWQHDIVEMELSEQFVGYTLLHVREKTVADKLVTACTIFADAKDPETRIYLSPIQVVYEFQLMMEYKSMAHNMIAHVQESDIAEFEREMGIEKINGIEGTSNKPMQTQIGVEGPAVHLVVMNEKGNHLMFDMAIAFPCQTWPSIAKKWLTRHRPCGWPAENLIAKIIERGSAVVPKSPEDSLTSLEWRVSFSLAERTLAEDLTTTQKVCYLVFKLIHRQFLKPPHKKGVQTYHLKNIFFWTLESVPRNEWTDHLMCNRVMDLLHRLNWCLSQHCCPHYFVPQNNLFADIDSSLILSTRQRLHVAILKPALVWYENSGLDLLTHAKTRLHLSNKLRRMIWNGRHVLFTAAVGQQYTNVISTREHVIKVFEEQVGEIFKYIYGRQEELLERVGIELEKKRILNTTFLSEVSNFKTFLATRMRAKEVLKAHSCGYLKYIAVVLAASHCLEKVYTVLNSIENIFANDYGITHDVSSDGDVTSGEEVNMEVGSQDFGAQSDHEELVPGLDLPISLVDGLFLLANEFEEFIANENDEILDTEDENNEESD